MAVLKNVLLSVFIVLMSISPARSQDKMTVIIDTPNLCCKVDRIQDNSVYLAGTGKSCTLTPGQGKASIEIGAEMKYVNIYADGMLWKRQDLPDRSAGISSRSLTDINVKADKQSESMVIAPVKNEQWAQRKAAEIADVVNSQEFQKKIQFGTDRLKKELFSKQSATVENYYKDDKSGSFNTTVTLDKSDRIYVIISSSVPIATLRNYVFSIERVHNMNVVLVLRGLINGFDDIDSTLDFASQVLTRDQSCDSKKNPCPKADVSLLIDPILFRRYQVTDVPAVVYASNVTLTEGKGSEGLEDNASIGDFITIKGDASLDYLIDRINQETHKQSLGRLVDAIRGGYYQ